MMRCIVIDDEPLALKLLTQYCSKVPSLQLIGAYTDSVEGIAYISALKPDLVFLDIQMPDLSGLQIADSLDKNTLVIFTTAYEQYAVAGFDLDVVDYLLKPFDFERFRKAYAKTEERFQSALTKSMAEQNVDEIISFKCNYQNIQLPLNAILYIEAADNYIKIVTADKTFMPTMTLKNIRNMLPETRFIRVHKSYIVPIDKIKSFSSEKVITDKIRIPVGRAYRDDFLEKMNEMKG
jgi:DNA-binding LytR/AlgR family response regulator